MPPLTAAACALAEEIRHGTWNHLDSNDMPLARHPQLIAELRRRVPGHSLEQYIDALADGLFASR